MSDYQTSAGMDTFCNESMKAIDTMHNELESLIDDENNLRQTAAAKGQGGYKPSEAITSKEGKAPPSGDHVKLSEQDSSFPR